MMETKAHLVAVTSRRQAFFYIFSSKKNFSLCISIQGTRNLRVHPNGFSCISVHAKMQNSAVPFLKMLECVSGFENFAKIFRI